MKQELVSKLSLLTTTICNIRHDAQRGGDSKNSRSNQIISLAHTICLPVIPAMLKARGEHSRESWVRAMEAKLVRDELDKCFEHEGVNHQENCKWLSEKYLGMLKQAKVSWHQTLVRSHGLINIILIASRVQEDRRDIAAIIDRAWCIKMRPNI